MMMHMADDALERGQENIRERMAQHRRALARARMRYRGIDISGGSPLVAFDSLDLIAQRDAEMLLENSRREAWEWMQRAQGFQMQASDLMAARSAVTATAAVGITANVLQSGYSLYSTYSTTSNENDGDVNSPLVGELIVNDPYPVGMAA